MLTDGTLLALRAQACEWLCGARSQFRQHYTRAGRRVIESVLIGTAMFWSE
jgi:hypothetical protein